MQHAPLAPDHLLHYPNLRPGNYEVTSTDDPDYNCAAWAVGDTEAKWWPLPGFSEYYWPTPRRDDSVEAFIEGFGTLGYEICENLDFEPAYEKLAIFATASGEPQHVARQLDDGSWTSKLGAWEDIRHLEVSSVECNWYGHIARIMRKQRVERTPEH